VLQKIQQRICVAEKSATHLRCRKFSNASALQKNQQRICVADFSATRMHLVQNPRIPTSSPATQMRC
jgi:hypothetical protein